MKKFTLNSNKWYYTLCTILVSVTILTKTTHCQTNNKCDSSSINQTEVDLLFIIPTILPKILPLSKNHPTYFSRKREMIYKNDEFDSTNLSESDLLTLRNKRLLDLYNEMVFNCSNFDTVYLFCSDTLGSLDKHSDRIDSEISVLSDSSFVSLDSNFIEVLKSFKRTNNGPAGCSGITSYLNYSESIQIKKTSEFSTIYADTNELQPHIGFVNMTRIYFYNDNYAFMIIQHSPSYHWGCGVTRFIYFKKEESIWNCYASDRIRKNTIGLKMTLPCW